MNSVWPVSVANGLLLAGYFIVAWGEAVWRIVESPVRGLYSRTNIAQTIFFSDYLLLSATGIGRLAWLMALSKAIVVAFFMMFLASALHALIVGKDDSAEPLRFALSAGVGVSFVGMICAAQVTEPAALVLHATESLLLLGGVIVLLVDNGKVIIPASAGAISPVLIDDPQVMATPDMARAA